MVSALLIVAFIIGAGDGAILPSLLSLLYIIYALGMKGEADEE